MKKLIDKSITFVADEILSKSELEIELYKYLSHEYFEIKFLF